MSNPTFASPERRSILLPLLLALAALAIAAALALHFFPATSVKAQAVHTQVLPTSTVYKAQSIVVGQNEVADTLFVASTLRVENGLHSPAYVDTVSLTLTDATGAELTVKALSKQDIETSEQSFPKLKSLVPPTPLPDLTINPGKSAEGTALFSLGIPQSLWKSRTSAVIKLDLYHQQSVLVPLPKP